MGLIVYTADPAALITALEAGCRDGTVKSWTRDSTGDYTHSPAQWQYKAWMRPRPKGDRVVFSIIGVKATPLSKLVYAVYHGRFAEMLLTHFDKKFTLATATARADGEDRFG